MSLCKFSSSYLMGSSTLVDNIFISEYLPKAPDSCVKVYMYGLMLCGKVDSDDNAIEKMSQALELPIQTIKESFEYWEGFGLVTIIPADPFEVIYTPFKHNSTSLKKLKPGKYDSFNKMVQELITGRLVLPSELAEYYDFIENGGFEPDAIICVINHCIQTKNNAINSAYITTILRDFSRQNIKSFKQVDEKFKEQQKYTDEIRLVLKSLGLKRNEIYQDEQDLYQKWITKFGFTTGVIVEVAKKYKNKGGFAKLDEKLTKCYENRLFTIQEIENYNQRIDELYLLAKETVATLGLYYQNLDSVVETYITDWSNKGYDSEVIKVIANYCFKKSIRTLEGMNTVMQKFYKLGLLTLPAISQYIGSLIDVDNNIQKILDSLNILRNVNTWDRDFYRTWTYSWKLPDDVILYMCEKAKDKSQPMQYLSKLLASLHEQNITTLEGAKNANCNIESVNNNKKTYEIRSYDKKELDSLFDNLDDIEV